jgi:hypothetical protein
MAKTKVKIKLDDLKKVSDQELLILSKQNPLSVRYEGEFALIRETKSGSVQIALVSWDADGDDAVAKLREQGDESLLFHVSKLEYDAMEVDGMTSKFFIRKAQDGTRLYIGLDNETSNTRKEMGVSVSGMTKLSKPAPTNPFALKMAQQIAAFKGLGTSGNSLATLQQLAAAQGVRATADVN